MNEVQKIIRKMNNISILFNTYIVLGFIVLVSNSYSQYHVAIISDYMPPAIMAILDIFFLMYSKEYCSIVYKMIKDDNNDCNFINLCSLENKSYSINSVLKKQSFKFAISLLISIAFMIKVCINIFIIKDIKFTLISILMCISIYIMYTYVSKLFIDYMASKSIILKLLEEKDNEKNKI